MSKIPLSPENMALVESIAGCRGMSALDDLTSKGGGNLLNALLAAARQEGRTQLAAERAQAAERKRQEAFQRVADFFEGKPL